MPSEAEQVFYPTGRTLLVEFVNADQFPGRISYVMPLVAGYYDGYGAAPTWIRFAVATTNLMEYGRDAITLAPDEEEALVRIARETSPEYVILTDRIYTPQLERTLAAAGGARAVVIGDDDGRVLFWLSSARDVEPRYDWVPGNEAARQRRIDNIYLHFARGCGHPRRVGDNPIFADEQYGVGDDQIGCTFCTSSKSFGERGPELWEPRTGLTQWAARQADNVLTDSRGRGWLPNAILFEKLCGEGVLREVIASLRRHEAESEVQLLFAIRTNLVPTLDARIRRHFDENPESELRFGVYASGVESFSGAELTLYNKATSPIDGLRAVNSMRALSRTYPGRFWYTGLSFLFFTPWTTLENLELNFGLIRFLGIGRKEAGNMYQSRLRLHDGLPLRAVVEAEGLIDDDVRDSVVVMNRRKLFGEEEPWRCAEPRVEPIMRIVLRLDLLDSEHADELTEAIGKTLRSVDEEWTHGDDGSLEEFVLAMIGVARAASEPLDESALLEQTREEWRTRRGRRDDLDHRPHFRLAESRCGLATLAERAARLVRDGHRAVVEIAAPVADAGDGAVVRNLAASGLAARIDPASDSQPRRVVLGRSADDLARHEALRAQLNDAPDDAQAVAALAELLAVPSCCGSGLALADPAPLSWRAFARRNDEPGAVPPTLLPLWVPALSFVPCRADCEAAKSTYETWFDALDVPRPPNGVAWVFSGAERDDGDLATLPVVEATATGVRYRTEDVRGSDPHLVARLQRGREVRTLPGQLRIVDGDVVVECLTATHGLWVPTAARHGKFWQELARGAGIVAATCGIGGMYKPPFGDEGSPLSEDEYQPGSGRGGEQGERDDGSPSLSPFETLIAETLQGMTDRDPAARGFSVKDVFVTGEAQTLGVSVELDGSPYELRLGYGDPEARCFFRAGRLAVSYQNSTPLTSPVHQQRVRELFSALDASLPADPGAGST